MNCSILKIIAFSFFLIFIAAPRNRQFGEPLIIADVRKGSVAHRTGSIQPGDKLLAVNTLRTENCTVEDVSTFLYSCNDIVKLRIRKDESFSGTLYIRF